MSRNSINPALAQMDLAQDEIATYAILLKRAQSSLTASSQAFERADENSTTGNCQIRQELTNSLRGQYAALTNLTDAIIGTLDAPTFSRIIATAPQQSHWLVALLNWLPEEEKDLLLPHTEGDSQTKIVLIDSVFSAIFHCSGDNLKDAVESFKSSVWQQGWGADEKVMREYGDLRVYKKLANSSLLYLGLMKDI